MRPLIRIGNSIVAYLEVITSGFDFDLRKNYHKSSSILQADGDSGNIGIGTSGATTKLQVNGSNLIRCLNWNGI